MYANTKRASAMQKTNYKATPQQHGPPSTEPSPAALPPDDVKEEGIKVVIRMRPLNSRESTSKGQQRVWRVHQENNSVTQTTPDNKPLPERIQGRSFFTYDRTFGEQSSTKEVYEDVAKGIVQSVSNGLNGTIFAYGQTSSGKTFTMQGSGSLKEGAMKMSNDSDNVAANGGIVHMAAQDIFNHIEKEPERDFLVRVSFIEIYNKEVRDLLVSRGEGADSTSLTVREDPRRGVFVNSKVKTVTGLDSLLRLLFAGEKNRSVAATGMNERSSRSHTIFSVMVESRRKRAQRDEDDDDDEEVDDNDAAVRVSTLNLVDLAGSESVRHTGATGDRQKEGGKINQSLLALSRVIANLGQNATHINFRDSKLTHILQPSLSGNARMAVICCATPSELYLEETRSTLQFASRAKLVKTRAQVNEVMSERSLIKKLQRELKEANQMMTSKDAQISDLQESLEKMKARLTQANPDLKASISANVSELAEANSTIDALQVELSSSYDKINAPTEEITQLHSANELEPSLSESESNISERLAAATCSDADSKELEDGIIMQTKAKIKGNRRPLGDISNCNPANADNGKGRNVKQRFVEPSNVDNVHVAVDARQNVKVAPVIAPVRSATNNSSSNMSIIHNRSDASSYQHSKPADDIHARDADDALCVNSYVKDIYDHHHSREASTSVRPTYMINHKHINEHMRAILIDANVKVAPVMAPVRAPVSLAINNNSSNMSYHHHRSREASTSVCPTNMINHQHIELMRAILIDAKKRRAAKPSNGGVRQNVKIAPAAKPSYVQDMYDHHRSREKSTPVRPTYMTNHKHINEDLRAILIDWVVRVHNEFEMVPETLYLAANILDRYLAENPDVMRGKLRVVGLSALFLASKYEEIYPPELRYLVYACCKGIVDDGSSVSLEQVLDMETKILSSLDYKLTVPTAYVFLVRYQNAAHADNKIVQLSRFILDGTLQSYSLLGCLPSQLAAAAVFIARRSSGHDHDAWSPTLQKYAKYSEEKIIRVAREVLKEKSSDSSYRPHLNAVKNKYTEVADNYREQLTVLEEKLSAASDLCVQLATGYSSHSHIHSVGNKGSALVAAYNPNSATDETMEINKPAAATSSNSAAKNASNNDNKRPMPKWDEDGTLTKTTTTKLPPPCPIKKKCPEKHAPKIFRAIQDDILLQSAANKESSLKQQGFASLQESKLAYDVLV